MELLFVIFIFHCVLQQATYIYWFIRCTGCSKRMDRLWNAFL